MFMAGRVHRHTWKLGLAVQALWLVWIVLSATWGFLPLNVVLWVVYYNNLRRWQAQEPTPSRNQASRLLARWRLRQQQPQEPQDSSLDVVCPACGHHCTGRGGVFCIDKPAMQRFN